MTTQSLTLVLIWFHMQALTRLVEFEGKSYTGYWSLCAAVNRALAVC